MNFSSFQLKWILLEQKDPTKTKTKLLFRWMEGEKNYSQIEQLGRFQRQHPMQVREKTSWKQWIQTIVEDN